MTTDLLTRIQQETHERLRELRDAVDEHDRLQGELRTLDTTAEPPGDPWPAAGPEPPLAREMPVAVEPALAPEMPVAREPATNVVRLPVRRPPVRTRMVSPKVARLMLAPRRPALERAGVVRVGAGRVDSSMGELLDEIDREVEAC
jgi:hypothetical protein